MQDPNELARQKAKEEGERPMRDYCWVMGDKDVRAKYPGKVLIVSHQVIWGVGDDDGQALADARTKPGCPPISRLSFITVPREGEDEMDEMYFYEPDGPSPLRKGVT